MKTKQERQYFAKILIDEVCVMDNGGREVAHISRKETFDDNPFCPEEAWESLLQRIRALYCCIV